VCVCERDHCECKSMNRSNYLVYGACFLAYCVLRVYNRFLQSCMQSMRKQVQYKQYYLMDKLLPCKRIRIIKDYMGQVAISECGRWPYWRGGPINEAFLQENVWAFHRGKTVAANGVTVRRCSNCIFFSLHAMWLVNWAGCVYDNWSWKWSSPCR